MLILQNIEDTNFIITLWRESHIKFSAGKSSTCGARDGQGRSSRMAYIDHTIVHTAACASAAHACCIATKRCCGAPKKKGAVSGALLSRIALLTTRT
jgi:hypothetical protein